MPVWLKMWVFVAVDVDLLNATERNSVSINSWPPSATHRRQVRGFSGSVVVDAMNVLKYANGHHAWSWMSMLHLCLILMRTSNRHGGPRGLCPRSL